MKQKDIVKDCDMSLGGVNEIIKQFKETVSVSPQRREKSGRKRKTTHRDD